MELVKSASAGTDWLEIVNTEHPRGPFRCVAFDFDGTLSLLRGNWQGLMVPMMVRELAATNSGESQHELTDLVEEFVTRLTGQPTLRQMEALADEVCRRGCPRPDPAAHLARYLDQLLSRTAERIAAVESGKVPIEQMLVPGTLPLVEHLAGRDMLLVIASGTLLADVERESQVLRLDRHFASRVHGPVANDAVFSKEAVLRQLMREHGLAGHEIVAIGDGPAEMLAAKAVGGLALGVASDEVAMSGRVNRLKREHLLRAGADLIVPDYRQLDALLRVLSLY
jgi:phosphoglycolate phosphatase